MKSNIFIINYNDINYIFIKNEFLKNKIENKEKILQEDLLSKYSSSNLSHLNTIIKLGNFEIINYEIAGDMTIYKLRYLIIKYIDNDLLLENQHLTIKSDLNYGDIDNILFKIYSNISEVNTDQIINYYKLLGFNILGNIKKNQITFKELKKYIEWDIDNTYLTLGYELIHINNNIELYFDGNFYKKNIDTTIFESFIYYNTNNKTLNEFNIINNVVYLYNYYKDDNYKTNVKRLLEGIKLNYKDDINLIYKQSLNRINLKNSNIERYVLYYNNKFNDYDVNINFNEYNLSEKIPFIKLKNHKSEYNYKIFINSQNDIPYIEQDILDNWISDNDNMKLNMIQIKIKYLNMDKYYDVYVSKNIIKFIFNLSEIKINIDAINNNINNTLKSILGIKYVYSIMNPLFTLKEIRLKLPYIINNINYKNIYYRLLFILLLDYENIILDIDYVRKNINKIDNLKDIKFIYKNSINYIYPINEINRLRDVVTYHQKAKVIEELHDDGVSESMIRIFDNIGIKQLLCVINYNDNIFEFKFKNLTNYYKIFDLDRVINNKLNLLLNDINLIYLFKNFNIHDMSNYDLNLYKNDLKDSLFIYKQFVETIYNKLNLNENMVDEIDDDFFDDLEDLEEDKPEQIVSEFREIVKKFKDKVVLNINKNEYKYNIFPKQLLKYLNIDLNNKDVYNVKIKDFNNYIFEILVLVIYYSSLIKTKVMTFSQIINSQLIHFLNNLKPEDIEEYIVTILKLIDYIDELKIDIIRNIRFELLDKNIVEVYLMILDFEYISSKNIERYNDKIYKKLGFAEYNQYSQLTPLDRQPIFINQDLYNILLENDTTGSINRIFSNELLTKKLSNEYYLCLINNATNKYNLLPLIDNISENVNSIYCHSFNYKQQRKINIKNLDEVKVILFTNKYMNPYNLGNISSNDIVKSIGYMENKHKHIKNILDISALMRVGIPINSNYSLFINTILFALNKKNITVDQLMNDIKLNITDRKFKKLNNGSLYYIFKKKIIDTTVSLSILISTYMTKSSLYDEVDDPYNNFLNYVRMNLKYMDYDIGLHLLSETYNVNIIVFNYNVSNIISHELLCSVPGIKYDFKNRDTVILLKMNSVYELIISYNYFTKYRFLFNINNKYFKNNQLLKLLKKCELFDNNIVYYNTFNYENVVTPSIRTKDISKLNIKYNVIDNFTIIGFIVIIKPNDFIYIPINILIDNVMIDEREEILLNTMLEKKKYIYDYKTTLDKLKRLNFLKFGNKVVLDNLIPTYINAIILENNNYIPIIPTKLSSIDLKKVKLVENDEIYINNIIQDIKKYKFEDGNIPDDYKNFKIILNTLFKDSKLNKEFRNILLKNDILSIYNYLKNVIKKNNIKVLNKVFIEYISYELLNNYITRYDILEKIIIKNITTSLKDNVIVMTENHLKNLGIANLYKSFYYKNNNLYTGNVLNNINLYSERDIICNKKEKIPSDITLLKDYYYYSLKHISSQNIIGFSECIYYNLEKVFKVSNLREQIFNYIRDNNLLKIYIDNIRKETNDIIYKDINSLDNLESIIMSSNHWMMNEDIIYLADIFKMNIIIVNSLNSVEQIYTNIDSKRYMILYEYLFYNKKIYYLVCDDKEEIIFDPKIVKKLISNVNIKDVSINITEKTVSTINNQYLYSIQTDKFSMINLLNDSIILDFDIQDIYNEIILVWKNLPFNYNSKFLAILNKLNINSKNSDKTLVEIIKNYPSIEINEPIIFPPFYHLDNVWNLRQNKEIYNIFAGLYETSELIIKYDSISIIAQKTSYYKTFNNTNSNNKIYGFLCLTPVIINYINNIDYLDYLFGSKKVIEIKYDDHVEYRINNEDIDEKYVESIKLEKGMLYLYSESLLFNLDISNYILGFIVDINYYSESKINKKMRIDAYESGQSLYNNFNLDHYKIDDIERIFNYFNLLIYRDSGLYLYDNYMKLRLESPIKYINKKRLLNEYNPRRVLAKDLEKNKIKLNELLNDDNIYDLDNMIINTLYNNKKSYKKLSKLGIQLIIGW
jgi:hypothetical protein